MQNGANNCQNNQFSQQIKVRHNIFKKLSCKLVNNLGRLPVQIPLDQFVHPFSNMNLRNGALDFCVQPVNVFLNFK